MVIPSGSGLRRAMAMLGPYRESNNVLGCTTQRGSWSDQASPSGRDGIDVALNTEQSPIRGPQARAVCTSGGPMPRFDDFQDYLYVSSLKAFRMRQTLRPEAWKRIKALGVNLGPAGAKIDIDNAGSAGVIALLPELRRALDEKNAIKDLNDPDLKVGHWFLAEAVDMTYGVPEEEQGAVLFAGQQGQTNLILSGSAEHLLDRRVFQQAPVMPGSTLHGLSRVLQYLHGDLEDDAPPAYTDQILRRLRTAEGFNWLMHSLVGSKNAWTSDIIPGVEPLTALARVLAMGDQERDDTSTDGHYRVVLGTPLYVAFHVPE
jgi:hypothetical protein